MFLPQHRCQVQKPLRHLVHTIKAKRMYMGTEVKLPSVKHSLEQSIPNIQTCLPIMMKWRHNINSILRNSILMQVSAQFGKKLPQFQHHKLLAVFCPFWYDNCQDPGCWGFISWTVFAACFKILLCSHLFCVNFYN